jgi:predicted transcriptional regulator
MRTKTQASSEAHINGQRIKSLDGAIIYNYIFEKKLATTTDLQMMIMKPKSTVTARLSTLQKNGLVAEKSKVGKDTVWMYVPEELRQHYIQEWKKKELQRAFNAIEKLSRMDKKFILMSLQKELEDDK